MNQEHAAMALENQLCFPLYVASREAIKRCRAALDEIGLTYTQYIVMAVIWEAQTISVRDLGRRLYLDSGTLTPVLKTLERMGFITRKRSKEDERVLLVTATEQSLACREHAAAVEASAARCPGLSEAEAATLLQLLNKLRTPAST